MPSQMSVTNGRRSMSSARKKSVRSAWVSTSRSSTSLETRVISASTRPSTRSSSALGGSCLGGQHLQLTADHVSGVRSSCDASATNARWLAKASERRSSIRLNASARTRTSSPGDRDLHPRAQIAGIDAGGDLAIRRSGADTRAPARYDATSASAAPRRRRARTREPPRSVRGPPASGSAAPAAIRTAPRPARSLVDPHPPDVRHPRRRVSESGAQVSALWFSICCSALLSPCRGYAPPNSSG